MKPKNLASAQWFLKFTRSNLWSFI